MQFLYRGISVSHFDKAKGMLIPKICDPFVHTFHCGEGTWCGCGATCGSSTENAVIRHQLKQAGFPTSGISTTPIFNRAKFYATHGGERVSGYIYKIDRNLLNIYSVAEYPVKDYVACPAIPEDEEVILVARDFGILPNEIVTEIISIQDVSML